ncbi:MAG: SDR family NAD(P)-dependent oxidoreductase [Ectothiorhodospiraceae bacterium]|nr:SDR family NAD(P)-dependent oxidoreductase [Chromatiales bacterium]MCP5155529.1 SDR family NAD(P)-dependent oxidoreductase [Ectothiorhodospiraceae bacterium]
MAGGEGRERALVTGASRGVGAAVVESLVARGMEVWAMARPSAQLDALASRLGCHAVAVDMADAGALDAALADLEVDVVVNNAGIITAVAPFAAIEPADIDRMLDVNLRATMVVTRALLPGMIARRRGHLFLVTSLLGPYAGPNVATYAATKAALRAFGQCLRIELAGTDVRLTEVAPGRVRTDIYREAFGGDDARLQSTLFERYRALEPAHVAQALIAALDMPPAADISILELSPTDQAVGGLVFAPREE